nr:MAG TPA: Arc-like DNA binding domain protein [Caudoviricetes sp.]
MKGLVKMARPVSTKATFKYRIDKAVARDVEDLHWALRRDTSDLVQEAIIDFIAKNAPKPEK